MKIRLYYRTHGFHTVLKQCQVIGDFSDYIERLPNQKGRCGNFFKVKEENLLNVIPHGFLPAPI